MTTSATLLKVLLRQRHLQGHRAFCKEYDRVARQFEPDLVGHHPSKAQFYRWLSGELLGLPYADHCRILERMFPGWTAEQLLSPYDGDIDNPPDLPRESEKPSHAPATPTAGTTLVLGAQLADVTAVFPTRAEFLHQMPPQQLFDGAKELCVSGLSLNMICQQYSDRNLIDSLETGTEINCLFLDPEGENIKVREREEAHPPGVLATLTSLNIQALRRLASKLSDGARARLRIRTYDEAIRFNIILIDRRKCVVQPYLPDARGVESPTLVIEKQEGVRGLFVTFSQVFASMWDRAKEIG